MVTSKKEQRGYDSGAAEADPDKNVHANAKIGHGEQEERVKYRHPRNREHEKSKGVKDLRDKADKNTAEKPTTASAKKGLKDLPSVVAQVGKSAVHLQSMYSNMGSVISILSGLSSSGEDDEGNTQSTPGKKKIIEDALSGAIAILIKQWGYDRVIDVFNKALENDGIQYINKEYRDIVRNALANAYLAAVQYGPNDVPIYSYSTVTTIGPVPSPLVTNVPDMYVQEYYIQAEDPYPGYIKWNSPDETEYVFTERKIGDIYYTSATEEVYSIAEQELATALYPYIENQNLTPQALNDLLVTQDANVESNTSEKTIGKGSGNSGQNAMRLLQQLLGFIATATNKQKSSQLPFSVLNKGSIEKSLQKFEKRTGEHKKMQKYLDKAVQITGAAQKIAGVVSSIKKPNI